MSANKTKPENKDVVAFLRTVQPQNRSEEGLKLNEIFEEATGEKAVLWGPNIIGYGTYHYKYESGREGDFMRAGFSPRKANISLYIMGGHGRFAKEFETLGKYKTGKSCVYINKLEDINIDALKKLIKVSYDYIGNKTWP
jgi:hypothetical protein